MSFNKQLWDFQEHYLPSSTVAIIENLNNPDSKRMNDEAVKALLDSGYAKLAIPESMGGGGANLLQSCAVQYQLGMVNPAMAVGFNMHQFTVGLMVEHWKKTKDISWMLL